MKKFSILLMALVVSLNVFRPLNLSAQILNPVKWTYSANRINDTDAEIVWKATIDNGWHLYSHYIEPGGPLPTDFSFAKSNDFQLVGKVIESKTLQEYDKMFEMTLKYFAVNATFKQKIKILTDKPFVIKGTVDYQTCDDKACIPGSDPFTIKLDGAKKASTEAKDTSTIVKITNDNVPVIKDTTKTAVIADDSNKELSGLSLWSFFIFAFLGGLVALMTPCIYPMIPMTITYFLHENKKRSKAIILATTYGLSIVVIYVLVGTLVAVIFGEDFANWLSTHWLPNIFFFLIFMVFAASFLGMFELTLPSWMITKSDKQADKGGFLGAFFMAFTLVLVSFSCTAPVVGSILAFSANGEVLRPIIGMLGYSLAFAIPFTLFAIFPTALNSLPKSGGWLNSVKVVLGFIELALGLKFLSVADQTYHWGILDREVYLALWIVIFTLMGIYLLGKIKFAHDSDTQHVGVPRLILAIITLSFVVYLIPGMIGAPLKALSGWLPPQTTLDFDIASMIRENSGGGENNSSTSLCEEPKYVDEVSKLKLPHGIKGYFDYEQAIKCSKQQNKPVFIDFTGHGCVNCREMEANVWSDPKVLKKLKNDFIVVALYTDDHKIELPQSEWVTKDDGTVLKTLGPRNLQFEISRFKANAQPMYFIVDGNGSTMTKKPQPYNLDIENFLRFLDEGLNEYKKTSSKKSNN